MIPHWAPEDYNPQDSKALLDGPYFHPDGILFFATSAAKCFDLQPCLIPHWWRLAYQVQHCASSYQYLCQAGCFMLFPTQKRYSNFPLQPEQPVDKQTAYLPSRLPEPDCWEHCDPQFATSSTTHCCKVQENLGGNAQWVSHMLSFHASAPQRRIPGNLWTTFSARAHRCPIYAKWDFSSFVLFSDKSRRVTN